MPFGYGVRWADDARAVLLVILVVAVKFAEIVSDAAEEVAADRSLGSPATGRYAGQGDEYSFPWNNYVVTLVYRTSTRLQLIRIEHLTIVSSVAGMNPF